MDAADRFTQQSSNRDLLDLAALTLTLGVNGHGIGGENFFYAGFLQPVHCGRRENGMCAAGINLLGTHILQDLGTLGDGMLRGQGKILIFIAVGLTALTSTFTSRFSSSSAWISAILAEDSVAPLAQA